MTTTPSAAGGGECTHRYVTTARPEPTLGADEREISVAAVMEMVDTLVACMNEAHLAKSEGWKQACFQGADTTIEKIRAVVAALAAPAVVVSAEPVADSEDWWIDLAERHACKDWDSRKADGFLNAVKALVRDAFTTLPATPVGPDEVDGWQPIETAPEDGSEFLAVWGRQSSIVQIVNWNVIHKFWQTKGRPLMGFTNNATAWMPLPEPPTAALASTKPSKGAA